MSLTSQMLADIEEIRQPTAGYAFYADTGDVEGYVNCFTPTCLFDQKACSGAVPTCTNHDEIRALYLSFKPQQIGGLNGGGGVHFATNQRITDLTGTTASGTTYFIARGVSTNGVPSEWVGYYSDKYVKTDQGWKFSERVLRPLLPTNDGDLKFD
jgi:hypothetical protein